MVTFENNNSGYHLTQTLSSPQYFRLPNPFRLSNIHSVPLFNIFLVLVLFHHHPSPVTCEFLNLKPAPPPATDPILFSVTLSSIIAQRSRAVLSALDVTVTHK